MARVPIGVDRVAHQVAIEVATAVRPPDRTAFSERNLRGLDSGAGLLFASRVAGFAGLRDAATGGHQVADQSGTALLGQRGIGSAPQTAADDDVSAVRSRQRVRGVGHIRINDPRPICAPTGMPRLNESCVPGLIPAPVG